MAHLMFTRYAHRLGNLHEPSARIIPSRGEVPGVYDVQNVRHTTKPSGDSKFTEKDGCSLSPTIRPRVDEELIAEKHKLSAEFDD